MGKSWWPGQYDVCRLTSGLFILTHRGNVLNGSVSVHEGLHASNLLQFSKLDVLPIENRSLVQIVRAKAEGEVGLKCFAALRTNSKGRSELTLRLNGVIRDLRNPLDSSVLPLVSNSIGDISQLFWQVCQYGV